MVIFCVIVMQVSVCLWRPVMNDYLHGISACFDYMCMCAVYSPYGALSTSNLCIGYHHFI